MVSLIQERSLEPIADDDLQRLADIARADRERMFAPVVAGRAYA